MENQTFSICEASGTYRVNGNVSELDIINMALELSKKRLASGQALVSPEAVTSYLMTSLHDREHEIFGCVFVDTKHRIISTEEMFRGTLNSASIYPREVAKRALQINASAVVFYHNHPSGISYISSADKVITIKLVEALQLVDVRVLDHIVLGLEGSTSFAEHGLL